jgi:hypothetical protein
VESLREEVEEKRSCCQAKGEAAFDVGGVVPLEGLEMLVIRGNGDYPEGVLNVSFDSCAAWAGFYDLVVYIVDFHVFNSRPVVWYTLVNSSSRRPG